MQASLSEQLAPVAAAIATQPRVHRVTSYENFDLHDYVSVIPEARVAAEIAASTAWRIDALLVNAARSLFRDVRQELFDQGVAELDEITVTLQMRDYAETAFDELGFSNAGPCEVIRSLNSQHDQWHDLAAELTSLCAWPSGEPRSYKRPSLDDVFLTNKARRLSEEDKMKLRNAAMRVASAYDATDDATVNQMYERRVARAQANNADIAKRMADQASGVYTMFNLALRDDPIGAAMRNKDFVSLPLTQQRLLIQNARAAAERLDERITTERMPDLEYNRISDDIIKSIKTFTAALAARKFINEEQSSTSVEGGSGPTREQMIALRERRAAALAAADDAAL